MPEPNLIVGNEGNDIITGTSEDDIIRGLGGNDRLEGVAGNDTVDGGEGTNSLFGSEGSDVLVSNFGYADGGSIAADTDTLVANYTNYDKPVWSNVNYYNNTTYGGDLYAPGLATSILSQNSIEQFNLTGSAFSDDLHGLGGNDTLAGGAGSDELLGDAGKDLIQGGTGNDTIDGGADEDNITGGEGRDSLLGQAGNDTINASAGNDYIDGGAGNDSLIGGVGNDKFVGLNSGDIIDGGEGIDFLSTLNASNATVDISIDYNNLANLNYLADFNYDNISIANIESIDNLTTGSGNDRFVYALDYFASIGIGKTVNANSGNDVLSVDYSDFTSGVVNTNNRFAINNNGTILLSYFNIEQFNITGTGLNDSLRGGAVNDNINGGFSDDSLIGFAGNDTLDGGDSNDFIDSGTGNDSVIGGAGNDTIAGVNSGDIIDGGVGLDFLPTLNASNATVDISIKSNNPINLDYGNTSIVTSIANIESIGNLTTGSGNDRFVYGSADSVAGKTIDANSGNDALSVDYSGYQGAVGNTRTSSIFELNNNSTDLLAYSNIEQFNVTGTDFNDSLVGGSGNDTINSGSGNDNIDGGVGNDRLSGWVANDTLSGGVGNDTLSGGVGNDYIDGGVGNDTLSGGTDSDRFIYRHPTNSPFTASAVGTDLLTDFTSGSDKIVLNKTTFTALTSIVGSGFNVGSEFAVVASDAVAATANALVVYSSGTGNLFYNQNGAIADLGEGANFATLNGISTLSADDFVLQ